LLLCLQGVGPEYRSRALLVHLPGLSRAFWNRLARERCLCRARLASGVWRRRCVLARSNICHAVAGDFRAWSGHWV